jgi:myo-inositol 2-dehydrogenase/D-chiro-inositol 1-dehydrogenase
MIRFGVIGAGRIGKVHGSKGMLAVRNVHNTTVELHSAQGTQADPVQNFFLERYSQAYANEIKSFITAVESGIRDPRPSGFDGLQAQILAEAATVSWQTGKPVKV